MSSLSSSILEVQQLKAGYGRAQVLFDVTFRISEGEVVTLLGRNGMGRSTTIKCLFGMLPTTGGTIQIAGKPMQGQPSHMFARHGLALVPEGRQIFSQLTVEENLVATARTRDKTKPHWTLERVYSLFPVLKTRSGNLGWQLSGGEQQMLAIGRALLTNPRILVLDEATEGLAPLIRDEIWNTLAALKREGLAQLVIDKNVSNLVQLADRHFVIEKGRTVWSGDSAALQQSEEVVHRYLGV